MPVDLDDIVMAGEEVPDVPRIDATPVQEHVPLIDATPVQEEEGFIDLESDIPIVLPILESRKRDRRPGKEPSWLTRAFFPFSFCLIGISAILILYLIIR